MTLLLGKLVPGAPLRGLARLYDWQPPPDPAGQRHQG